MKWFLEFEARNELPVLDRKKPEISNTLKECDPLCDNQTHASVRLRCVTASRR